MKLKEELDKHKNLKLPTVAKTALTYMPTVEAQVDATPQILRPLRPFAQRKIVGTEVLTNNARYVLEALFACFTKQGYVKEGLVKDLIFGFVDVACMDANRVAMGLIDLQRAKYIGFKTQDNVETDETCSKLSECFIFYKPKLLEAIY